MHVSGVGMCNEFFCYTNFYVYQAGRILFVVLSTEHTGKDQKEWVRRIFDAVKDDDTADFIISVNYSPIQAEQ